MSRACPNALSPGTQIDKYAIQDILGVGGFGITYLARDTSPLNRKVAIKECYPADFARRLDDSSVAPHAPAARDTYDWCVAQFLNEARILANIHHPNVVTVHDCFEANGTAYMITAFVPGGTLEARLARLAAQFQARPAPDFLATLLARLLAGIDAIHARRVLHRDIKPENILLDETNDHDPVLIDFGSARQAIGTRSQSINVIVTPGYAPFEQYHTAGNQGPWTDLYALGAVCYRAIHGEKPPEALRRERHDDIVNLAQTYRDDYPPALLATIDRALLRDETRRFQTAREWLAALHTAPPLPLPPQTPPSQPPLPSPAPLSTPLPMSPEPDADSPTDSSRPELRERATATRRPTLLARLFALLFTPPDAQPHDNHHAHDNARARETTAHRAAQNRRSPDDTDFTPAIPSPAAASTSTLAAAAPAATNSAAPAAPRWTLEGRDPDTGRAYHFAWSAQTHPAPIMGRSPTEADFCVENETVSRQHIRFCSVGGQLMLTDLRSSNGTRKNGAPVPPHHEVTLADGDTLTLGQVTLTLRQK